MCSEFSRISEVQICFLEPKRKCLQQEAHDQKGSNFSQENHDSNFHLGWSLSLSFFSVFLFSSLSLFLSLIVSFSLSVYIVILVSSFPSFNFSLRLYLYLITFLSYFFIFSLTLAPFHSLV
jgi:hypothetical protein